MTNAARKCFIARQSRLTPTFVSTAVFSYMPIPAHERNSKCTRPRRPRRPRRRRDDESVAGLQRCSVAGNECSSQRDRRPRPLEILSSSAVNREVGSFASSEVNRALKAATTFSPSTEGALFSLSFAPPGSPLLASCSSMRTGSSSVTLEESNKASRYDAAAGLLRCM